MSCFVCFGSAAHDGESRKPPAAGAGKDVPPDRAVVRVGSGTVRRLVLELDLGAVPPSLASLCSFR
jgi:hypothetical protein